MLLVLRGRWPEMKPSILAVSNGSSVEHDSADWRVWSLGGCLITAFLFCYAQVLIGMVYQWWLIPMYSYAFLIPLISGYLIWVRRDALYRTQPHPNYAVGAVVIVCGLVALIIGQVGSIVVLQQISFMIVLPGLVLLLFGSTALEVLMLPILFLGFMIPIWDILTESLHFPFQNLSADLGVLLLRLVGIPVYQDGVFIHLPNITLEVARSCSGVNYLIAVLATSIPLATIVLTDVRRRIALVMLAMTVSALANSLRVALIGVLAYYDLSGDLHGPYHTLHGVFVSLIGYVVIFGGLWGLSRGQQGSSLKQSLPAGSGRKWSIGWSQVRRSWSILAASLMLVGTFQYVDMSHPMPLRKNLSELSLTSMGWIGRDVPSTEKIQGADWSLSRVFRAVSEEKVHLSVWYFEAQRQGKELVSASTAKLHSNAKMGKIYLGIQGEVEVNQVLQRGGDKTQLILFWYDLNGRIVAGRHAAKFYTVLDSVVHARTNGALVWVAVELHSEDQVGKDQALTTLTEFLSKLYPALQHYLPSQVD